jgi:hypothetical protein
MSPLLKLCHADSCYIMLLVGRQTNVELPQQVNSYHLHGRTEKNRGQDRTCLRYEPATIAQAVSSRLSTAAAVVRAQVRWDLW